VIATPAAAVTIAEATAADTATIADPASRAGK